MMTTPRLRLVHVVLMIPLLSVQLAAQRRETRAVPGNDYLLAFEPFFEGDYRRALDMFKDASRGGVKSPERRWVDAICYDTMIGECMYHTGNLRLALDSYNSAVRVFLVNTDWLKRLQYPPQVQPKQRVRLSWGPPNRKTVVGQFPDTILTRQDSINAPALVNRNIIITQRQLYPIRGLEIMRCMALALARRNELLGPLAPHDNLSSQIERRLAVRTVAPNHWAKPILDVQLALAKVGAGFEDEGYQLLQRSLTAAQMDHPLTSRALIEIGKLAIKRNQLDVAFRSFYEATFPAAQLDQYGELEEAFVMAAKTHRMSSNRPFPQLQHAATWLRTRRFSRIQVALLLASAELSAFSGNTRPVSGLLAEARRGMGRTDLPKSDLGAKYNYLSCLVSFANGKDKAAFTSLSNAFSYQKTGSVWGFQLSQVFNGIQNELISTRIGAQLFETVLRSPSARDWRLDPMETMTFLANSHREELELWMQIAFERNEIDNVVQLADRIRQEKFFAALPLYGRLLSLRWVLEASEVLLDEAARQQRQNLRNRYPEIATLSAESNKLKAELSRTPALPQEASAQASWKRLSDRLAKTSEEYERLLRKIALCPEPADTIMPPVRTLDQIQSGLTPGQAVLDVVTTKNQIHMILISADKDYQHWEVKGGNRIRTAIANLLKSAGSYDRNRPVSAGDVSNNRWEKEATGLSELIFGEQSLTSIDELIIVPDGVLWYLPFDLLSRNTPQGAAPLIEQLKIRYLPMASLAVADPRQQASSPSTVIVSGRLFDRTMDAKFRNEAQRIASLVRESVVQSKAIPVGSGTVGHRWGRLVVIDDIEGIDARTMRWSPAQADAKAANSNLSDWVSLPWGAPQQVVLPGFHTAAENGSKLKGDGDEMLLTTLALMSAGSRTVLLSRWRTGGQTSMDLVREFLAQLSDESAASAWQRSVQLTRSSEIDPDSEPRVKGISEQSLPTGSHPFFWAGYQLFDLGQPGIER